MPVAGNERTTVLVADARPDVREALSALLDATDEFEVVGEASSTHEAADQAATLAPQIVVLDPNGRYDEDALARLVSRPLALILLTLQDGQPCRSRARALGATVLDKGV